MNSAADIESPAGRTILFITKGERAASTRYRMSEYQTHWARAGWTTSHLTHNGSLRCWMAILRQARRVDMVVILRRTFRFPFLNLLRALSRRLVFDFDDAIFVRGSGEESYSKRARFGRTVAACDLVWAGNRYLAENAMQFNRRVVIIPTAVNAEKYAISPPKPKDTLDLVWIGSSATRKHLMTILPALERAAGLISNLRLKVIADFSITSEVLVIEPVQWSLESEADGLASSHIGIAPLPDNAFTRGKCGLKILQYMAAGLPVIASPVGVNADLVRDGVTGYTAVEDSDWIEAIRRLSTDAKLRQRFGEEGRRICNEYFTFDRVFQRLIESLSDIHDRVH